MHSSVNKKCLSLHYIFNLQKHGISIPFCSGDSRSKYHAQKPANLIARFYGIPHSRTQPICFQFTHHLKILGASIFLLWLYDVANKKLKCSNTIILPTVRVCAISHNTLLNNENTCYLLHTNIHKNIIPRSN